MNVRCVITADARSAANTTAPEKPTMKPASRQYALSGLSRPSPTVSITFSVITSKAGASNPCNTETYCSSIPKSFPPSPRFEEPSVFPSGARRGLRFRHFPIDTPLVGIPLSEPNGFNQNPSEPDQSSSPDQVHPSPSPTKPNQTRPAVP